VSTNLIVTAARDGREVELPKDLDAIDISTAIGRIHIDLRQQVPNMVLIRASEHSGGPGNSRLIISPMDGVRVAIGVIKA